ncbi:DEAD/DEAH box helicase [Candidatus Woesearchaeota archaeon CG10_big_fil_rev_8_21_14_0_10_44_13]|nr:MAG: DEAD/DEAH box helicase [Candidatus Woesearchaeota archaeon CG10_big_fil_rev_8_21_14_0_10_44_13]
MLETCNYNLKDMKPRLYQETIFDTCNKANCLVVLPTGMGKTTIALMLAAQRLKNFPNSKVLLLAPTRPLVEQHIETFRKYMDIDESSMAVFTGFVSPEKRAVLWKDAKIIFSTPQGLENDIISRRINLEEVSLVIFDEAHKATGDYAYVFVAKQYNRLAKYPKILGLTASPGSETETIAEVCKNLHIEAVEIRTDSDPDVKPYIQEVKMEWVKVNLPEEMKQIQVFLQNCSKSKLAEMNKYGYLNREKGRNVGKLDLLRLQGLLHSEISKGNKEFEVLKSISLASEAIKVQHALELLETQGITPLYKYFEKVEEESSSTKSKAVQNLVRDLNFKSAFIKTRALFEQGIEHPKTEELKRLIAAELNDGTKMIIFTQYRDTASKIEQEINSMERVKAKIFVGQAKKNGTGLSQKQQKEMLEEFSTSQFNILIATSVAEEGLDIPKVDVVIFYEPIPSAIRHIQRRGRTGRLEKGKVFVLVTRGTRDEGFKWSAFHKEKRMHRTLKDLKTSFSTLERQKENLDRYIAPELDLEIYADDREKNGVVKELVELGIKINTRRMETGDYILSSRCAVEYKKVPDFVDSIIDGRLLQQVKELRQCYDKPLVVVEGDEDIYSMRKIHPNAIRGMLAAITVNYGVPIIQTKTSKETAALLAIIAKREHDEGRKGFDMHTSKPLSLKEQQEYIISSFPGIGSSLAKPLLRHFKSIKNFVNASEEELQKVEKIGEKKAKELQKVLNGEYKL